MYSIYNRWLTLLLLFILAITVYYRTYIPSVYILETIPVNVNPYRASITNNPILPDASIDDNDNRPDPTHSGSYDSQILHFLPQFKNPCFLRNYDASVTDKTYYRNKAFIARLEKKYGYGLRQNLHRATISVRHNDGTVETKQLSCLPYYYVMGVAKTGSTDLYERLLWHKDIAKAVRKENAYFNTHRFENYTVSDYVDVFDPAAEKMRDLLPEATSSGNPVQLIVGDHSTNTFTARRYYKPGHTVDGHLLPNSTAEFIKLLNPEARFIVLFRNPVERAYSHYKMHYAKSPTHFHNGVVQATKWITRCFEREGFSEYCLYTGYPKHELARGETSEKTDDYYDGLTSVRHGIYYAYVKDWLRYFPKQQFLFMQSEEYYSDPYKAVTEKVFPFLGLNPLQWYNQFAKLFISNQHGVHVTSRLVKTGEKDINTQYNEPMFNGTRQLLEDFYREYNVKLAEILDNDAYLW